MKAALVEKFGLSGEVTDRFTPLFSPDDEKASVAQDSFDNNHRFRSKATDSTGKSIMLSRNEDDTHPFDHTSILSIKADKGRIKLTRKNKYESAAEYTRLEFVPDDDKIKSLEIHYLNGNLLGIWYFDNNDQELFLNFKNQADLDK